MRHIDSAHRQSQHCPEREIDQRLGDSWEQGGEKKAGHIERQKSLWEKLNPPEAVREIFMACPEVVVASTVEELVDLACGGKGSQSFETAYTLPDGRRVVEAITVRVRNGISVNYTEPYMRRRDPDCMLIGDTNPTDKETYRQRFGKDFEPVRQEAFAWLKTQRLATYGFVAGKAGMGMDAIVVAPDNTGFFALGLALLQGIIPISEIWPDFKPRVVIYVAPTFRHTHFAGRQIVVHRRSSGLHEVFSFNLYPGPSAKKGIYGVLLELGEREGWVATHCSTVQVITPYDNLMTIMHEGASGGGKSEMLEQTHREMDGRLLLGENTITGERVFLEVPRSCELRPVNDDMALCHPSLQKGDGKLVLCDAEEGWFVRVNHISHYGTDPHLEKLAAEPPVPLLFLNIDAVPGGRALIWEHIEDAPGKPCPNPRVIIPRHIFANVVDGPVAVDVRSFGIRTPPCTKDRPTYGIVGIFHVLPPALAWLWRLVAPRGHANPSIVDTEGMTTEGVGSYWPFAPGRRVAHANLLLRQFVEHTKMRYILCPNQYIGAWRVGFMPQWLARDYLARRGVANFRPDQLQPARCPLLGYVLRHLQLEGRLIDHCFLRVETQPEVGEAAYDIGAQAFQSFFRKHLPDFLRADLSPLGKEIITCCLDGGKVEDYERLIPIAK